MKVQLSAQAHIDMLQAHSWMKDHVSDEFADRTIAKIAVAIHKLGDFPLVGRRVQSVADARQLVVGKYLITYRVQPSRVLVVLVRHTARLPMTPDQIASLS